MAGIKETFGHAKGAVLGVPSMIKECGVEILQGLGFLKKEKTDAPNTALTETVEHSEGLLVGIARTIKGTASAIANIFKPNEEDHGTPAAAH